MNERVLNEMKHGGNFGKELQKKEGLVRSKVIVTFFFFNF